MNAPTARGVCATLACLVVCLGSAGCPNSAGITCPSGQMACNGACIPVAADAKNCGSCGHVCPAALACIDGACGCPGALASCGDVCVDTNVDRANCGGCGIPCGPGQICMGGKCALSCTPNRTACGDQCVDTMFDNANCGICAMPCGDRAICCGGRCVSPGTIDHCGSCAPCPNLGDFCSPPDGPTGTFQCLAG